MAYYTALIAAWNTSSASTGALPTGVAGTSLFGLSTTAKIAAVNGWTVTGTVPTTFFVTGAQIANCINYAEFKALTDAQRACLLAMFQIPGPLLGGSANTAFLVDGMIIDYFPLAGPTVAALTALASAQVQPWWSTPVANGGGGLGGTVGPNDAAVVGLT